MSDPERRERNDVDLPPDEQPRGGLPDDRPPGSTIPEDRPRGDTGLVPGTRQIREEISRRRKLMARGALVLGLVLVVAAMVVFIVFSEPPGH